MAVDLPFDGKSNAMALASQEAAFSIINFIYLFIFLSLIFGSFLGINNKRIIKLFAASSISNTGFILLFIFSSHITGINEAAINISIYSIYHYIILYIINICNFFYILLMFNNLNHIFLLKDLK